MDKIVKSQKRLKKHTINRAIAWLMAVLMCFSALPTGSMTVHATDAETVTYWTDDAYVATEFADGTGTEGDPYIIETEAQLAYMVKVLTGTDAASYKSSYFKVADGVTTLDMKAHEWTPIPEFAGVFDGNGVTIDGLTIKTTSTDKVGFFSVLNEGAEVQNVDFTNVNIDASCDVDAEFCAGTIAGRVSGVIIDNCKVLSGTVKATGQASGKSTFVGGLIGGIHNADSNTVITNCFNNSSVEAVTSVGKVLRAGGIYGSLAIAGANAEIINCANTGSVTGTNTSASAGNQRFGGIGGIVTAGTVVIKNCYNAGAVNKGEGCKGSVKTGSILGAGTETIDKCYTDLAEIQSADFVGTLNGNAVTLSDYDLLDWQINTSVSDYPVPLAEARMNGTYYSSLVGVIGSAEEGAEITQLVDIDLGTDASIAPGKAITLDLNGNTLTVGYFTAFTGTNVVDNSENKTGVLKASNCALDAANTQMPVYNGTDGYVFADIAKQEQRNSEEGADTFELIFRPSLGTSTVVNNTLLASGGIAAKITIGIRLEGTDAEGIPFETKILVYDDAMIDTVYSEGKAFYIKASGVNSFKNVEITPFVQSQLNNSIVWNGTTFAAN